MNARAVGMVSKVSFFIEKSLFKWLEFPETEKKYPF